MVKLSNLFKATVALGGRAKTLDLKGEFSKAQVFRGGKTDAEDVKISAAALKPGQRYLYEAGGGEGRLTIEGDIPAGVRLTVINAKLAVNGNVGGGVKLRVEAPVAYHNEVQYIGRSLAEVSVIDGLRYDDPSPAIVITGAVSPDVKIVSNAGIVINGKNIPNNRQLAPAPKR